MGEYKEFQAAWAKLSFTQKAQIKLKQRDESRSAMAIYADWPSLFDPSREQDRGELKACRELMAERPELFPGLQSS